VESQIWSFASKHLHCWSLVFLYLFHERTGIRCLKSLQQSSFTREKLQWFPHINIYFSNFYLNSKYYFNFIFMYVSKWGRSTKTSILIMYISSENTLNKRQCKNIFDTHMRFHELQKLNLNCSFSRQCQPYSTQYS
jgi:hypothetical protein